MRLRRTPLTQDAVQCALLACDGEYETFALHYVMEALEFLRPRWQSRSRKMIRQRRKHDASQNAAVAEW
jgi:hypothetical protein